MVAGDKIHDVIDEELEKAKAVIVLWSPTSVKSDWVKGEAQTAHESAKLVPIKIAECKLPINYRSIHTPELYKSKAELDKLAQTLSDKFRTAQPLPRGGTAEPSTATKIEFTAKSSADFLTKLRAQAVAFEQQFTKENVPFLRSTINNPLGFLGWLLGLILGVIILIGGLYLIILLFSWFPILPASLLKGLDYLQQMLHRL